MSDYTEKNSSENSLNINLNSSKYCLNEQNKLNTVNTNNNNRNSSSQIGLNIGLNNQHVATANSSSSTPSNHVHQSSDNHISNYTTCANTSIITSAALPSGGLTAPPHYFSPILNTPQSFLRPLMTTQPPLYSPILSTQQHNYPMPHASPSGSYPSMHETMRNSHDSIICQPDVFKDVNNLQNRSTSDNNLHIGKQYNLENQRDYTSEVNHRRHIAHSNYIGSRFSSCSEVGKSNNNGADIHFFEEYVRLCEEGNFKNWQDVNSSAAISSTFPNQNKVVTTTYNTQQPQNCQKSSYSNQQPHSTEYSDCRLENTWNRNTASISSTNNIEFHNNEIHSVSGTSSKYEIKYNFNQDIASSSVNKIGENGLNSSGKNHFDYSSLSAGHLASILPYLQPINYQQPVDSRAILDSRNSQTRSDQVQFEATTSKSLNLNENHTKASSQEKKHTLQTSNTDNLESNLKEGIIQTTKCCTRVAMTSSLQTALQNSTGIYSSALGLNSQMQSQSIQETISSTNHQSQNIPATISSTNHHSQSIPATLSSTNNHSQSIPATVSSINHHSISGAILSTNQQPQSITETISSTNHQSIPRSIASTNQPNSGPLVSTNHQLIPGPIASINHQSIPGPIGSTNHQSTPGPIASTNHQSTPGPIASTNHQSIPGPIASTNHQSIPGPIASTNHRSIPGPIASTNHQSISRPITSTNHQSIPGPIASTNHQSIPEPIASTNHQSIPEPIASTNHQSIPGPIASTNHQSISGPISSKNHPGPIASTNHQSIPGPIASTNNQSISGPISSKNHQSIPEPTSSTGHRSQNNIRLSNDSSNPIVQNPIVQNSMDHSLQTPKDQILRVHGDSKKVASREEGNHRGMMINEGICLLCGTAIQTANHCSIDTLITVPSKISVIEKLSIMVGFPIPREFLPSLYVCPKCFHLINEVDVLEHRLNVCRREVLYAMEQIFERNGVVNLSPYKRFQRQQCVVPYPSHEMQFGGPYHQTNSCFHVSYQNEAQNFHQITSNQVYHQNHHMIDSPQNCHQSLEMNSQVHSEGNYLQSNDHINHQIHHHNHHQQENHLNNPQHLSTGHQQKPNHQTEKKVGMALNDKQHGLNTQYGYNNHPTSHQAHLDIQQNLHQSHNHLGGYLHSKHNCHSADHSTQVLSSHLNTGCLSNSQHSVVAHPSDISKENPTSQAQNSKNKEIINTLGINNIETSLQSKDLRSHFIHDSICEDKNDKNQGNNNVRCYNQVIPLDHQVPVLLPAASNDSFSHPLSPLLSPYQHLEHREEHHENRELNDNLIRPIVDKENFEHTEENMRQLSKDKESLTREEFTSKLHVATTSELDNWSSACNNNELPLDSVNNKKLHLPEVDIDIENCDPKLETDFIRSVSPNLDKSKNCKNYSSKDGCVVPPIVNMDDSLSHVRVNKITTDSQISSSMPQFELNKNHNDSQIIPSDGDLETFIPPPSPPPPPEGPPEGLRNVQDATEYHKPTLLGKNIKVKKHAKLQICRQCDQVFSNRQALIRHIERRHKSYNFGYSCDTCHRKFNSERMIKRHMQTHKTYLCKICGKIFLRKTKLKKHSEEHNKINFSCKICNKDTGSMQALISHSKTHDRLPKSFVCTVCSKNFTCKRNLIHHSRIHSGEKPFACENCGTTFRHKSNMISHNKLCSGTFQYVCSTCGRGFALKSIFDRHVAEHEGNYAHSCSICDKGFGKCSDLLYHFSSHSPTVEKQACKVCDSNAGCNSGKILTRNKKTKCPVCGKEISQKNALRDHLAHHAGRRDYKCKHCSSAFIFKSNLFNHIKFVHLQQRPFTCDICHKTFTTAGSHKMHLMSHTGERPFQCSSCGKAFTSKSNYKRHLKCHVVHKNDDDATASISTN